MNVHDQSGESDKFYALELQNQIIFFLKDCQGDIMESLGIIKSMRDNKDKIKKKLLEKQESSSLSHDSIEFSDYKNIAINEKMLYHESNCLKTLTNENVKFLFDQFFKVNYKYNKEVYEIWKSNGMLQQQYQDNTRNSAN